MDLRAHVQGWILLLTGGIVAGLLEQVNRAATIDLVHEIRVHSLESPGDIAVDASPTGGYRYGDKQATLEVPQCIAADVSS
jgi:hypothetical protein